MPSRPEDLGVSSDRLERVADLVVPFRRKVYQTVAAAFAPFAQADRPRKS